MTGKDHKKFRARGDGLSWLMQLAADKYPEAFKLPTETQARYDAWRAKKLLTAK